MSRSGGGWMRRMDARTRTLLEAVAFGDGDDLRPADRLRAAELLESADGDDQVARIAEILRGMTESDLQIEVDELAAAHVLDAWRCPDRWPAISQALRRVVWEARDSRESPEAQDAVSSGGDGAGVVASPGPSPPTSGPPRPVSRLVERGPDPADGPPLPSGIDSEHEIDVGWRPFGDGA